MQTQRGKKPPQGACWEEHCRQARTVTLFCKDRCAQSALPGAQKGKKPPQQGSLEEQRMLADMAVAAALSASASQRFAAPDIAAPPFDPGVGARQLRMRVSHARALRLLYDCCNSVCLCSGAMGILLLSVICCQVLRPGIGCLALQ